MIQESLIIKFANSSFLRVLEILKFIESKSNGVTVQEVEYFWENHRDGKKMTRSLEGEKRIIDNTIRNILNRLVFAECLIREKKSKSYIYKINSEIVLSNKLGSDEITDLIRWAITFNKYKGLTFMNELEEALNISIEDLLAEENLKLQDIRPYIDFETTTDVYSGWGKNVFSDNITDRISEYMTILYKVISITNDTIEFKYRSFQEDNVVTVSHAEPYLLKEHNKRWYLIAFDPHKNEIFPFSLDRIVEFNHRFSSKKYNIPHEFNPKTFWKDCVGVFKDDKSGPKIVSFELKNGPKYNNQKYLISSPMHTSQKAIYVDHEWMRFEYFIHIGPEVIRQIRQWGIENLRNIQPKELDDYVRYG